MKTAIFLLLSSPRESLNSNRVRTMKQKNILGLILVFGWVGCATGPRTVTPERPRPEVVTSPREDAAGKVRILPEKETYQIDYRGLQSALQLERPDRDLGFAERSFASCEVGYGFPSSRDCRRRYFSVIHFRLLCRESEGTIQTPLDAADLRPLARTDIEWTLMDQRGEMTLDDQGYGQIRTVTLASAKVQRLKINVGPDFLYMRAGEMNRVVAPAPFCP